MQKNELFSLVGKIVIITGGAGLLGRAYASAILEYGGIVVLADIDEKGLTEAVDTIDVEYANSLYTYNVDLINEQQVIRFASWVEENIGEPYGLINNAARNPKVENGLNVGSRLEYFDLVEWHADIDVGLTSAFLCSKHFGPIFSQSSIGGVIINISSDLGLIAPNQNLYRKDGIDDAEQPVKPISYSVTKAGIIGLTRYLATYWPNGKVRSNAICPGGVLNGQDSDFIERIEQHIPVGRMARTEDYKGVIVFLLSSSSSYMNGSVVSIDGGRVCW